MKLSELIKSVGDENIVFQNLLNDLTGVDNRKKESRITFSTEPSKGQEIANACVGKRKCEWTAFVLWIPTDKLPPETE